MDAFLATFYFATECIDTLCREVHTISQMCTGISPKNAWATKWPFSLDAGYATVRNHAGKDSVC
jgi:hypothetical protein